MSKLTPGASSTIDVVDLFGGCGGFSYGFESLRDAPVRFRACFSVDLDPHACATFEAMVGAKAYEMDVRDLLDAKLRTKLLTKHRRAAPLVVVGGPPCQGFSSHRKKDVRVDTRNSLLLVFGEIALAMEPEFIVLENVPEIFDAKHWPHFSALRALLEDAGYRVRARVYDLAAFGVPQARYRALMIARRAGRPFSMPEAPPRRSRVTVRQAISHLPPLRAGEASDDDPMHVAPAHTQRIVDLMASVPPDGGSRRNANTDLLPKCHDTVDGFRDVYGRLAWDQPSISITAKCSTPSCGRFVHPEQHRSITVREAALLQGFPEAFAFSGPLVQRYRQVGNAVSPTFSALVGAHIASQMGADVVSDDPFDDLTAPIEKSFTSSIAGLKRDQVASVGTIRSVGARGRKADSLTAIDCFAGAGGLSLGVERAGFRVLHAFDADPYAVATYRNNLGPAIQEAFAEGVDARQLLRSLDLETGECTLVAGGPPCQGFSQQRRGADEDPRNELVLWYADFIAAVKPLFFLMENVTYLAASRGKEVFATFLSRMAAAGYTIQTAELDATDFGVAQRRCRVISIGHLRRPGLDFRFPSPTVTAPATVRDAIGGLPTPPADGNIEHPAFANHIRAKINAINAERISHVPQGGGWKDIPEHLQLDCHKRHRGQGHVDVYGRLSWDEPARTLTGGFDSFSRGQYAHPVEDRPITGREAAAIQSFPHWYRFVGPKKIVAKQIGNAVPPLLAEALGRAIAESVRRYLAASERPKGRRSLVSADEVERVMHG